MTVYSWVHQPSVFVDVPRDMYLIVRADWGLVARLELVHQLPFHSEIVTEVCAVLEDIENDVDDPGYPMLDGRPVEVS